VLGFNENSNLSSECKIRGKLILLTVLLSCLVTATCKNFFEIDLEDYSFRLDLTRLSTLMRSK
jgi:hypothetical protein